MHTRILPALLLCFAFMVVTPVNSYAGKRVCQDAAGNLVLKRKCNPKKGLQPANIATAIDSLGQAGPQGPRGDTGATGSKGDKGDAGADGAINISSCYEKSNFIVGTGVDEVVNLNCNNTDEEFLLRHYYMLFNAGDTPTSNVAVIEQMKDAGNIVTRIKFSRNVGVG